MTLLVDTHTHTHTHVHACTNTHTCVHIRIKARDFKKPGAHQHPSSFVMDLTIKNRLECICIAEILQYLD